jgi:hypothetical protein
LVTFPLVNIRDQHQDEDFIGPDMHANPLPEGFSRVAPGTAVNFSRHVDTALTPPTTRDYTDISVVMNMTHVEPYDLPPPNSSWPYYLDSSGWCFLWMLLCKPTLCPWPQLWSWDWCCHRKLKIASINFT